MPPSPVPPAPSSSPSSHPTPGAPHQMPMVGSASQTQGPSAASARFGINSLMTDKPLRMDAFLGLSNHDLVDRYSIGIELCDPRVVSLEDHQLDTAFLPEAGVGRWPIRVLLGHLADAELVFVHRMRRAVAEDHPLLAVFDEQAFIDSGLYSAPGGETGGGPTSRATPPPIGAFLATIHTLRKWTTEWLASLTPRQWERGALHPERGPLTVRKIAEYDTWHLENHVWYLNRKVAKFAAAPT
ncbi:MAG: DinB family protein [Pyrinomonadaceae bacterium]|nr:DinB family protein [Phycisphaerales bacterium]